MAYSPQPFDQLIGDPNASRTRTRAERQLRIMYGAAAALAAVALACTVIPVLMQLSSSSSMAGSVSSAEEQVSLWPKSRVGDELRAARAYNRQLARSDQPVLGEAVDPFADQGGGFSRSSEDKRYNALLNEGHGVMGSVIIPKISVNLPIYHGTGERQLSLGTGHLYGSSLPIGGRGTHAVITGHRGMVKAQMFTRLDEIREGDFVYIRTLNETLAYEVDHISVIEPNDTTQLRIAPGQDRLTLMTCTPYGINSHRLLVSGHRVSIPVPAPNPADLHDGRTAGGWVFFAVAVCGCAAVMAFRRLHHETGEYMRHATRRYGVYRPMLA